MKILKLKNSLLSLMAAILVIAFASSCEKQSKNTTPEQVEESSSENFEQAYKLPKGYENLNGVEIGNYLNELSDQELEQLVENNRIAAYLVSINEWNQVNSNLKKGAVLTEGYVSKFLTEQQILELKEYTFGNEINSRWCGDCNYVYSYCPVNGCRGVDGKTYSSKNIYERYCEPGYTYICRTTCS